MYLNQIFKSKLFLLFFFIISLFSCTNHTTPGVQIVDLDVDKFETKELMLSDFVDDIEYIKLEVNDSCYLGSIEQTDVVGKYVFILDLEKLCQFDRKGNFIRKISREGEGPGEYIYISNFCVFPDLELIAMVERAKRKIMFFDFDGLFVSEFKMNHYVHKIIAGEGKQVICLTGFPEFVENDNYSISVYDFEGNLIKRALDRTPEIEANPKKYEKPDYIEGATQFAVLDDTLTYWERGADYIYKIDKDFNSYPRYSMNIKYKRPVNPLDGIDDSRLSFCKYFEIEEYLFFLWGSLQGEQVQVVYNKETGEKFNFNVHKELDPNTQYISGFVNDIDGGWPLIPLEFSSERKYLFTQSIEKMKEMLEMKKNDTSNLKNINKRKELLDLVEESQEGENTLVMIYTPKK